VADRAIEEIVYEIMRDMTLFRSVVVTDYLENPQSLTSEQLQILEGTSTFPASMIKKSPRGTVIGQEDNNPRRLYYPFFSSHISLPVKPSEKVWAFETKEGISYWLSRKVSDFGYEDACFTRTSNSNVAQIPTSSPSPSTAFLGSQSTDLTGRQTQSMGLPDDLTQNNLPAGLTYNQIESQAVASKDVVLEPVPVVPSLCNELTLQGSNNAVVTLGTGFDGSRDANHGFVDISTGRGRGGTDLNSVFVTTDSRTNREIASRENLNPREGSVDVSTDASRILVTTQVDPDGLFSLSLPSGTVASSQSPSIVQKSDKIRIIARQDVAITVEGSSGASVVVNSNGDIYLTPSASGKVYLSGPESDQAYLRYDDLREVVNGIEGILNSLIASINLITQATPGATAIATVDADGAIVDDFTKIENAMISIKSEKILGS